jgi:hypothetical protein
VDVEGVPGVGDADEAPPVGARVPVPERSDEAELLWQPLVERSPRQVTNIAYIVHSVQGYMLYFYKTVAKTSTKVRNRLVPKIKHSKTLK